MCIFWRLWVCSNHGAAAGLQCESPVVFAVAVRDPPPRGHVADTHFAGWAVTWGGHSLPWPPHCGFGHVIQCSTSQFLTCGMGRVAPLGDWPGQGGTLQQGCSAQWQAGACPCSAMPAVLQVLGKWDTNLQHCLAELWNSTLCSVQCLSCLWAAWWRALLSVAPSLSSRLFGLYFLIVFLAGNASHLVTPKYWLLGELLLCT